MKGTGVAESRPFGEEDGTFDNGDGCAATMVDEEKNGSYPAQPCERRSRFFRSLITHSSASDAFDPGPSPDGGRACEFSFPSVLSTTAIYSQHFQGSK